MRVLVILSCVLLLSCGRPLTDTERAFLADLHGPTLDPEPIRLVPAGFVGIITKTRPVRPRTACRERIKPLPEGDTIKLRAAGMVGFNTVFLRPDWALEDFVPGYPDRIDLASAMFFAHEMTHVWQWQNRHLTRYHPLKGAAEHRPRIDPYLFEIYETSDFLDYEYEQQASLVEEYVCCQSLDPGGARTHRLAALLSQVMDVSAFQRPAESRLSWPDIDTAGICS